MALTIAATRAVGFEQPERLGRNLVLEIDWSITSTYVTNGHTYTAANLTNVIEYLAKAKRRTLNFAV